MITLASDFGTPYPAAMKGVVLRESDARLVDVAHDFPRQDVRSAAFWLRETLPEFPPAVHLVVVDPGVGTDRDALVVRAGDHALVGPDNGVLLPAARALCERQALDAAPEVFVLDYETPASHTFHGRDVFAPAAARVHETGVGAVESLDDCAPTDEYEDVAFPDPDLSGDTARGEVLVVDGFGNVVTNLPGSVLEDHYGGSVSVNGERVPVERSYAHVAAGERLLTVGSHGNVECAVNRGRGDEAFDLGVGDAVELLLD